MLPKRSYRLDVHYLESPTEAEVSVTAVACFNCETTATPLSVFVNRLQLLPHIYLPGSSSPPKNSLLACSPVGPGSSIKCRPSGWRWSDVSLFLWMASVADGIGKQSWFFFLSCKCIKVICEVVNAKKRITFIYFVKNLYKNPSYLELWCLDGTNRLRTIWCICSRISILGTVTINNQLTNW